ncbi:ZYRO0G01760p [Zygosaccharomyces rouxii]|uniref:NADPH:adrenodoxin oxidoreductase, mitochondrial n=2 Tax=Zygosaccharomyces rouxii TaxID=4956 RepID=C5E1V4_ZYGRC|nr:uncharacterized protein ZYRO0G01760g [Zygosaccharomyces rouxii]KAH9202144.1 hypothetical protein LQ764DRAFT_173932 [Zygosaccharomyces rouxii]CAR29147.1 ZYRO0G01760p [Zygosaccharomyces rouxii]
MILDGLSLKFVRWASKRISVVGSGPSGFYTAYRLLNKSPDPIHVTLWEKLPVPYGLSRYGVAPDHPEVKNCEDTFAECAETFNQGKDGRKFSFIGGVTIGSDEIPLQQLLKQEDAVILAYGCQSSRALGIPGEDASGVFSSRDFVNWYNGHPGFANDKRFTEFDWSQVHRVGIIGHGNVALDITRVLMTNRVDEIWQPTDISRVAIDKLKQAPIQEVKMIARRDFIHSKFTNRELRELWEMERFGVRGKIDQKYFHPTLFNDDQLKDRPFKRRVEMCQEYSTPFDKRTKKNYKKHGPPPEERSHWVLDYLKTPLQTQTNDQGRVQSLQLCENELTPDNRVKQLPNSELNYNVDLLITSLGYKGQPMSEFKPLAVKWLGDRIANDRGRVLTTENEPIERLYAAGWIRRGSQGVIATTMEDSFQVADQVLHDLQNQQNLERIPPVDLSNIRHTTWQDWEKINQSELNKGKQMGRVRSKYLTEPEIYNYLSMNH